MRAAQFARQLKATCPPPFPGQPYAETLWLISADLEFGRLSDEPPSETLARVTARIEEART